MKFAQMILILGMMAASAVGCVSGHKLRSLSPIMSENKNTGAIVIPLDELYVRWLKIISYKGRLWDSCLQVHGAGKEIREYYSDSVYFTGEQNEKGFKQGAWRGYAGNKLVIETAYLGGVFKNSPVYLKIWDGDGALDTYLHFGIPF